MDSICRVDLVAVQAVIAKVLMFSITSKASVDEYGNPFLTIDTAIVNHTRIYFIQTLFPISFEITRS
jgi:hypothetical protein